MRSSRILGPHLGVALAMALLHRASGAPRRAQPIEPEQEPAAPPRARFRPAGEPHHNKARRRAEARAAAKAAARSR